MIKYFFTQEDLKKLFSRDNVENHPKPKSTAEKPPLWKIYVKFGALFIAFFFLTYFLVNYSALAKNLRYFWDTQMANLGYKQSIVSPEPTPILDPTSPAQLVIPKIGVEALIIWNVDEEAIPDKLLEGVVHFKGTALPGQIGNIFITGHSSYYSWSTSPYKDVFALLEKISVGDKIYIQFQGATFTYVVTDTKVVSPKEISVMDQTPDNNLTLMTCVPIGTNLNRLIVTSKQMANE